MSDAKYLNPLQRYGGKVRNALCPCGSGKKVKKCHGFKNILTAQELNEINRAIEDHNKQFIAEHGQTAIDMQQEAKDAK
jgi:hypothetical protein